MAKERSPPDETSEARRGRLEPTLTNLLLARSDMIPYQNQATPHERKPNPIDLSYR
jgi:hypothetical protein